MEFDFGCRGYKFFFEVLNLDFYNKIVDFLIETGGMSINAYFDTSNHFSSMLFWTTFDSIENGDNSRHI